MTRETGSLKHRIVTQIQASQGLTDRELTNVLLGKESGQQAVNQAARALEAAGCIVRRVRPDGKIGNFPVSEPVSCEGAAAVVGGSSEQNSHPAILSEDDVKRSIATWLETSGWTINVKWGHERGIDIEAVRDKERWIIEAKGSGSLNPMRVNYFLMILGETLQRMDDEDAKYSIALPDLEQYRRLWSRLPHLAKARTRISMIFVAPDGQVREEA